MKKIITATLLGGAIVGSLLGAGTANADQSWTMPNLVGTDLQGAQDAIQSLTQARCGSAPQRISPVRAARRSWTATGSSAAQRLQRERHSRPRPPSTLASSVTRRCAHDHT